MTSRYPIGTYLKQMSALLDISPARVLRRVGLSPSLVDDDEINVVAAKYFQIWEAMKDEADRPGIEMLLAMTYAHGPFVPPIFAFSCADTLALGVARLSDFKPLIGPMVMDVSRPNGQLRIDMRPTEPSISMPASLGLFELIYITECARTFTGKKVIPAAMGVPSPILLDQTCLAYLGGQPDVIGTVSLTFSADDADLPLITRSASLWETLEPGFLAQLEERTGSATMSGRIKSAFAEALPGGSSSVDDMAKRLNISRRSLQRRLTEEGTSFQKLLNESRFEMSERYLKQSDLSVPEISYLLGYRDTSSFFRAFQSWTGMTPGDYRALETSPHISPFH